VPLGRAPGTLVVGKRWEVAGLRAPDRALEGRVRRFQCRGPGALVAVAAQHSGDLRGRVKGGRLNSVVAAEEIFGGNAIGRRQAIGAEHLGWEGEST
jgi:hypothetical protein